MPKYSIKCSRCGAPIHWNNSTLNVSCEYCGQPVNQFKKEDNFKIKSGSFFKKIPFPSKEKIREKGKVLLSKQKILSESQLQFIGINLNRVFGNKRNLALLIALPIGFYSYMKINYPITAKPFYPDLPYKMPSPESTGNFWLLVDGKTRESIRSNKYWCSIWGKKQYDTLSECINRPKYKGYFSKDSEVRFEDWKVFQMGQRKDKSFVSREGLFDAAVNCKKGLIAYYRTGGLFQFSQKKSQWPTLFDEEHKLEYERKKPASIVRKMGKLWWETEGADGVSSDLEDGIYISWHKEQVKEAKERLKRVSQKDYCGYREGYKHKCTNKHRLETINSSKEWLKGRKESLKLQKFWRLENGVRYSQLYKAVCKNLKTKKFPG